MLTWRGAPDKLIRVFARLSMRANILERALDGWAGRRKTSLRMTDKAPSEPTTLSDVAKKAGVSMAAASRALNGRDGVDPCVRQRIQEVADELRYRPNRAARQLAGGRSSIIGLTLGNQFLVSSNYATALLGTIATAASTRAEGLMLIPDSGEQNSSVDNFLHDGMIDGVIISAMAVGSGWIEEFLDSPLPTIMIGAHPDRNDVHVVDVDNQVAARDAVEHLFDNGHRRIGAVTGPRSRVDSHRRLAGYYQAHERHGIAVDPELVIAGDYSNASGYEAADDLFAKEPDAIFAMNDDMAYGIVKRAHEQRVDIPGDISLIGFDATNPRGPINTPVTSMVQPFAKIANVAVQSLIALVEGKEVPREQLLRSELQRGQTVRDRSQA